MIPLSHGDRNETARLTSGLIAAEGQVVDFDEKNIRGMSRELLEAGLGEGDAER